MKKVISMVAMMVFMNTAMVMAASDLESYSRQDGISKYEMTQVELMGDKQVDSDYIDPTKAGVRV